MLIERATTIDCFSMIEVNLLERELGGSKGMEFLISSLGERFSMGTGTATPQMKDGEADNQ